MRRRGACVFVGDPQAFCLISRGGFCLAPEAICWRTPFVLPLHERFGHRSRITGNTAITGAPLFVSPTTTSSAQQRGRRWIPVLVRERQVCYEEERVKNNQDMCWEMKSLAKYALFFSLGSAQTKMASSGFLGGHWQCCNACFFKWHRLILHLWRWINKLEHDKSLWFIMFPPVYNQVEWERGSEADRGRLEETET